MAVYLIESKADQQKLIDYVGEDTAKLFFSLKDRLKSPENDIYYWLKREPTELEGRLQDLQNTQTRKEKNKEAQEGAEVVYSDDIWKVYHITTYPASVKYGKNTQWCIAGSKRWSNGERGEEYFNDYTSKGVEFYFYIKSNDEKYALALYSDDGRHQVFNQVDDDVTREDLSFLPNVKGLPRFNYNDVIGADGTLYYDGGDIPRRLLISIKKVVVQDGVDIIPSGVFYSSAITSIKIPESVSSIGEEAFSSCDALEEVYIPNSVKHIGNECFGSTYALKRVHISENPELKAIPSLCFGNSGLKSITIPSNIQRIRQFAFYDSDLKEVTFSEGLSTIGKQSFSSTPIRTLKLPSTLHLMMESAFRNCGDLTSVDLSQASELNKIESLVFAECSNLREIKFPEPIWEIGEYAFVECSKLESISLSKVYAIGDGAFFDCTNLREVYLIDTNLSVLGGGAFSRCSPGLTIYVSGTTSEFVENSIKDEYRDRIKVVRLDN